MLFTTRAFALCAAAILLPAISFAATAKQPPSSAETFQSHHSIGGADLRVAGSVFETVEASSSTAARTDRPIPAPYDWFSVLSPEQAREQQQAPVPMAMPVRAEGIRPGGSTANPLPAALPLPARPVVPEAWFTGPIAAASANTLPRGHVLFEPYLYDVRSKSGKFIGSTVYLLYGVTDRLTVGIIPTFGSARSNGSVQARLFGIGDASVTAQFRIHTAEIGKLLPTAAIVVQRVLPLGRFDRLGSNADRGIGGGAAGTLTGLYMQWVDLIGSGRPRRIRINLTYTSFGDVSVRGVSVYGTAADFAGRAKVGGLFIADAAVEYSVSRRWAGAVDVIYRRTGAGGITDYAGSMASPRRLPREDSFSVAPAIEYSWSARQGVLLGARWTARSVQRPGSITPVAAFNVVF